MLCHVQTSGGRSCNTVARRTTTMLEEHILALVSASCLVDVIVVYASVNDDECGLLDT